MVYNLDFLLTEDVHYDVLFEEKLFWDDFDEYFNLVHQYNPGLNPKENLSRIQEKLFFKNLFEGNL